MKVTSRDLVELVLLGPTSDRRQLQDSPVLGDVWIAFADKPAEPLDLLITPYKNCPAGPVSVQISKKIKKLKLPREKGEEANVAYLQGLVAARLFFQELIRLVVPMTQWWRDQKVQEGLKKAYEKKNLGPRIQAIIRWAQADNEETRTELANAFADFPALDRYVALTGVILWAGLQIKDKTAPAKDIGVLLEKIEGPDAIIKELQKIFTEIRHDAKEEEKEKKGQSVGLLRAEDGFAT